MRRKIVDCSAMPVMPGKCKTCPFGPNGSTSVRNAVISRTLVGVNQTCHTTGAIHGREDTHLCQGAREFQLQYFHRVGVLAEPTQECWDRTLQEMIDRAKKATRNES